MFGDSSTAPNLTKTVNERIHYRQPINYFIGLSLPIWTYRGNSCNTFNRFEVKIEFIKTSVIQSKRRQTNRYPNSSRENN